MSIRDEVIASKEVFPIMGTDPYYDRAQRYLGYVGEWAKRRERYKKRRLPGNRAVIESGIKVRHLLELYQMLVGLIGSVNPNKLDQMRLYDTLHALTTGNLSPGEVTLTRLLNILEGEIDRLKALPENSQENSGKRLAAFVGGIRWMHFDRSLLLSDTQGDDLIGALSGLIELANVENGTMDEWDNWNRAWRR